jgi:ATP-dependent RNA helicase SUPV3L1/SUV3
MRTHRDDQGVVTAVLGPTNTGKTHLAVERMLGRRSGIIGLPLRLLAREVYDRVVKAKGVASVALVTGEEKIVPKTARYYICTVEAMPMGLDAAFVAIDEIQLAADSERGHVFTDRLLYARGLEETMLLGAGTMAGMIRRLVPDAEHDTRERFSQLSYAGPTKLTRLPRRSAVVAFSAESVYAIAELLRRRRGGAAVVMGGLSPRTRNAQVELYQSGEVDFLVATDAIGMGLNMDVERVAFAESNKFDGRKRRRLTAGEMAQIAGRAGRFRQDGSFGETGDCPLIEPHIAAAVENHTFAPVEKLQWRNPYLDESSLDNLLLSLNEATPHPALERAREAMDEETLAVLATDHDVMDRATSPASVGRLWEACRLPDFRKSALDTHVRLVKTVFTHLTTGNGRLPAEWLDGQLSRLDNTAGDVDALASRLAHVRTWAYAAHRLDWTEDAEHWRGRAREVEDSLSDALHERLMQRFVDRRTSALVKGLRDEGELLAGISPDGEVTVEGHYLGRLDGLSFRPDALGRELEARTLRSTALKALRPEINRRLGAIVQAHENEIELSDDGQILWKQTAVARLAPGQQILRPVIHLLGGELGAPEAQQRARIALEGKINAHISKRLAPLIKLAEANNGDDLPGLARGLAWRLHEAGGSLPRHEIVGEITELSQVERRALRALGVRIGEHVVFLPALLKPATAKLNAMLRALIKDDTGRTWLPAAGLTSVPNDRSRTRVEYAACGFYPCGPRAIRLDILERLADLIRDGRTKTKRARFELAPEMTAILGCSVEDLRGVLTALNYRRLKKGVDPEKANGEMWGPRARRKLVPAKTGTSEGASIDGSNPFAALADLRIAQTPKPRRSMKGKPRGGARTAKRKAHPT